MVVGTRLEACLASEGAGGDRAVASVLTALALAAAETSTLLRNGGHDSGPGPNGLEGAVRSRFTAALRDAPTALLALREAEHDEVLDPAASLAVALSPLDGADNLAGNLPAGTIFSLRPAGDGAPFRQPGRSQVAAGFVTYGPRTDLALTWGRGVRIFTLDPASGAFHLTRDAVTIPPTSPLYAVDAANARFWEAPVRAFVDDCLRGSEGPRGQDFAMGWSTSLAAGAHHILARGGVQLMPGETRRGCANGQTRLVHEAAAIALVMEAAGGAATDGRDGPILDLKALDLHQRTPFVFGSAEEVACVGKYHDGRRHTGARSPLFGQRGLLRA
ncbi:fructose 1,6-bisphosphatase [Methylobacterium nodulans]|uniref:Fructose-1,6-bisphosphatase class 1 n=1 Tax=Methylobacterium nodulans (strain LMG 21967 / CNCM I-2342 / ORS 2060) TaxID=460265 RepID=B8IAX0_METNO|nr:fructose 1,6-bisphosphatase [Methylobacterium nodulans]ACL55363.1 Inositol phosphatase/fructose-16-bisphosphatase [Methylobacterium nodulans ORS 2060]